MRKKDFVLISEAISDTRSSKTNCKTAEIVLDVLSLRMAERLAITNPRFDRYKFLKSCNTKLSFDLK